MIAQSPEDHNPKRQEVNRADKKQQTFQIKRQNICTR